MSGAKSASKKRKPQNNKPNHTNVTVVSKKPKPMYVLKTRISTLDEMGNEILFVHPLKVDVDIINAYFREKIITNDGIAEADDGIYTWIIIGTEDNQYINLYAAKTISRQEIGTLHKNIYDLMAEGSPMVVAAGEFEKTGDRIEFNLQSGTYMEPKVKGKSNENKHTITMKVKNIVHAKMHRHYSKATITHKNSNILAGKNIRTPSNTIALFKTWFHRKNNTVKNAAKP